MQERPFTYHERADFSPAACLISGRTENLIDLGAPDLPYYGRVYMDVITFAELATAMGYIDATVHTALQTENGRLQRELTTLRAERSGDIERWAVRMAELRSTPNRDALKEFQDAITDLVSGLTDRLFRPGDGVPDLPVPTDEQVAVVSDIGTVGSSQRAVPRRGKQKPGAAKSKPEIVVGGSDPDVGGDPESTPASSPSGGLELHESAERDESADGDSEPDLEGFFDAPRN